MVLWLEGMNQAYSGATGDSAELEAEIIRRVNGGERDEFRKLVLTHQDRVFSMIMRAVGDREVARELTQDTFVRAYKSLGKFRFEATFSTWVTRIAINLAHSYFSSRRFKEEQRTQGLTPAHTAELRQDAELDTFDTSSIERLRGFIAELSPKYREVVILVSFENKTYEESARILSIPVGTVRSRLNKARLILRQRFFEAVEL